MKFNLDCFKINIGYIVIIFIIMVLLLLAYRKSESISTEIFQLRSNDKSILNRIVDLELILKGREDSPSVNENENSEELENDFSEEAIEELEEECNTKIEELEDEQKTEDIEVEHEVIEADEVEEINEVQEENEEVAQEEVQEEDEDLEKFRTSIMAESDNESITAETSVKKAGRRGRKKQT